MKTIYMTLCIIGLAITISFSLSLDESTDTKTNHENNNSGDVVSNKGEYKVVSDIKDGKSQGVNIPTYYQTSFRTGDVLFEAIPAKFESTNTPSNKEFIFNGYVNSNTILITKRDISHNIETPLYFHIEGRTIVSLPLDGKHVKFRVLYLNQEDQEIHLEFVNEDTKQK